MGNNNQLKYYIYGIGLATDIQTIIYEHNDLFIDNLVKKLYKIHRKHSFVRFNI